MKTKNSKFLEKKIIHIILSTALLILCLLISIKLDILAEDDAYIHFRIAENLVNFHAPYFNVNERIMSTSSFIWTFLLATFAYLNLSLLFSIAILNSIIIILGSYIWVNILLKITEEKVPNILSIMFQIVYVGLMLPSAIGLMETPLAMMFFGIGLLLISEKKLHGWIFFVLAMFTRNEIIIYTGLFVIFWFFKARTKKERIKGVSYLAITCIVICFFLIKFYSTIIPNTIIAKNVVFQINPGENALHIFYPFYSMINSQYFIIIVFALSSMIVSSLIFDLYFKIRYSRDLIGKILIIGGLLISVFYIIQKVLIFRWYTPIYTIPIMVGLFCHVAKIIRVNQKEHLWNKNKTLSRFSIVPIALLLFIICLNQFLVLGLYSYSAFFDLGLIPYIAEGMRVQRYLDVGKALYEIYPDASLLTSEIGGLGYSFKGEIIDGIGLVTPRALNYHPMMVPEQRHHGSIGAIPAKMVKEEKPELIVSYSLFVNEFDSSVYRDNYSKIAIPAFSQEIGTQTGVKNIWGSDELFIYVRNDIASSKDINLIIEKFGYN